MNTFADAQSGRCAWLGGEASCLSVIAQLMGSREGGLHADFKHRKIAPHLSGQW
jgi:hypothetical protein